MLFLSVWTELIHEYGASMFSSERLKGIDVSVCVADSGSFKGGCRADEPDGFGSQQRHRSIGEQAWQSVVPPHNKKLVTDGCGVAFYRTCTGVLADLEEAELSCTPKIPSLVAGFASACQGLWPLQALPVILRFAQEHALLLPHISFSDRLIDPVEKVSISSYHRWLHIWPATLGHRYLGSEWHIFCASPGY